MNINKLDDILQKQTFDFSDDFAHIVLDKVRELKDDWLTNPKWLATGIAASVIICLSIVYLQDGGVSYDNILGLSEVSTENLNEMSSIFN